MDTNFNTTQALINLEHALCTLDGLIVSCKDYNLKQFRIVAIRKGDGEYYKHLKAFLMRYFTELLIKTYFLFFPNFF